MSEFTAANLFAPPGGWRVRILDLSGGAEGGISEEIRGFPTLMQANEFARRYVRDSVELCRAPDLDAAEIIEAWRAFGEDAEVLDAGEGGWQSEGELYAFATNPAPDIERDWRALDPRGDEDGFADDDAAPGTGADGDDEAFDDDGDEDEEDDDEDGEDAAG